MTQEEAWKVVGANIRRLRLAAEMTQAQMAEAVHVSQPRIAQIESGAKDCTVGLIADIAEVLHEPLDMLFRTEKTERTPSRVPRAHLTT